MRAHTPYYGGLIDYRAVQQLGKLKMNTSPQDQEEGRYGPWMQTSLGGRFYPADPRPEEVFISDIANGLAMDCRYSGQGRIDRFYSVAEHSALMAWVMMSRDKFHGAFVALLHDAHEAMGIRDVNRAGKWAINHCLDWGSDYLFAYDTIADKIQDAIWRKYDLEEASLAYRAEVKLIDQRMVPLEKQAIMRHLQPWAYDEFEPLEEVTIMCLDPRQAKILFVQTYWEICARLNIDPEEIEI